jgi:hypothetical protein
MKKKDIYSHIPLLLAGKVSISLLCFKLINTRLIHYYYKLQLTELVKTKM